MLRVDVNIQADLPGVDAILRSLESRTELNQAMAEGVDLKVRTHLLDLNSRSPHTNFYARAAASTQVKADDAASTVTITHMGLALRYYGGHVVPVKPGITNLALPTANVPVLGGEERARPDEMGILAFIPNRGTMDEGTTGVFVAGKMITNVQGKNKGRQRVVPVSPDSGILFVLRKWTDHNADESVLPSIMDMQAAASDAASNYIAANAEGGLN